MRLRHFKIAPLIFTCLLLFTSNSIAQETNDERHIEVSMRMIGHQILLDSGDSTSLVLPIEKEGDQYKIQFEAEFEFTPDDMVETINRVVGETKMSNGYILEVENCETGEIVYSYKMDNSKETSIIPCRARTQPKSCYRFLFTLIQDKKSEEASAIISIPTDKADTDESNLYPIVFAILCVLFIGILFLRRNRLKKLKIDPNLIPLGLYNFDKRNTELIFNDQRIELTSKEADLLLLLYNAVNKTVEREHILNIVWGDEGDYVGRTLDVFISKLRKKLEFDSKVKIVNIRGIGYKLVMDV